MTDQCNIEDSETSNCWVHENKSEWKPTICLIYWMYVLLLLFSHILYSSGSSEGFQTEICCIYHSVDSAVLILFWDCKYYMRWEKIGDAGYRSPYLSHAKRALYHLSYIPTLFLNSKTILLFFVTFPIIQELQTTRLKLLYPSVTHQNSNGWR